MGPLRNPTLNVLHIFSIITCEVASTLGQSSVHALQQTELRGIFQDSPQLLMSQTKHLLAKSKQHTTKPRHNSEYHLIGFFYMGKTSHYHIWKKRNGNGSYTSCLFPPTTFSGLFRSRGASSNSALHVYFPMSSSFLKPCPIHLCLPFQPSLWSSQCFLYAQNAVSQKWTSPVSYPILSADLYLQLPRSEPTFPHLPELSLWYRPLSKRKITTCTVWRVNFETGKGSDHHCLFRQLWVLWTKSQVEWIVWFWEDNYIIPCNFPCFLNAVNFLISSGIQVVVLITPLYHLRTASSWCCIVIKRQKRLGFLSDTIWTSVRNSLGCCCCHLHKSLPPTLPHSVSPSSTALHLWASAWLRKFGDKQ